jgi:hypothetical protein
MHAGQTVANDGKSQLLSNLFLRKAMFDNKSSAARKRWQLIHAIPDGLRMDGLSVFFTTSAHGNHV